MRMKLRAEAKRKFEEEKEERLLARWLLFAKGRGQSKNLNQKEQSFIKMVEHKAYDRYMSDLTLGTKTRLNQQPFKMIRWTPNRPCPFVKYCYYWRASAKRNYLIYDVPKFTKMRWEALKNGSTNSEMPELGGRYMQELQRQISERERGDLGVPVSDLQVHPGSVEGRDQGQKPVRSRRKSPAGSNRDAATVGA